MNQALPFENTGDATREALLRAASIEISPRDKTGLDALEKVFARRTEVFINAIPGRPFREIAAMAALVKSRGFRPVPHLAARTIASRTVLEENLRALAQAEVEDVLLIGGDVPKALGPFTSARDLLEAGALKRMGIKRIGFGGYPEGHPEIPADVLAASLQGNLALAEAQGLETQIVTQFCFDATPILDWLAKLRASGISTPVRVGVAGPASLATLMRYAVKCGVGNSVRMLRRQGDRMIHLMGEAGPDIVVRDFAHGLGPEHGAIAGFHLFPFGGIVPSAYWVRSLLSR